jgi:hypothetical protein
MSASAAVEKSVAHRTPPFVELGLIARTLIALASACFVFFAVTFLSIVAILIYCTATGAQVDYSLAYRITGLAAGILMLIAALAWDIWAGIYRMQHPTRARE